MQNLIILASKNIKDNDDFMKFYIKRRMEKAIYIAIVICSPLSKKHVLFIFKYLFQVVNDFSNGRL